MANNEKTDESVKRKSHETREAAHMSLSSGSQ